MGSPRTHRATEASSHPQPLQREDDCRCHCGRLVARIVEGGVVIKCRRCKRDLLVPWSAREDWVAPVETEDPIVPFQRGST